MSKAKARITRAGPGRRPAGSPKIDRPSILRRGLDLARTIPLQELSIVRLGDEFGVTAASIRYYLRGRSALTAGVVNVFFRDLLEHFPVISGDWKTDVPAVAEILYRGYLRYRGIAAYFAAENRFRILAAAAEGEDGLAPPTFLERYFAVVREVGLDVERTSAYAILLLQLLHMAAHASAQHQWPGQHNRLKKQLQGLDPAVFPNVSEMRESYVNFSGEIAFKAVLSLVLSGLEVERDRTLLMSPHSATSPC